jgi:hypothetical protein
MRLPLAVALLVSVPSCARATVPEPSGGRLPVAHAPYALEVVGTSGAPLPTFEHRGRTHVLGTRGERYLLRVRNPTHRRIEVVASVDGRDVVDGGPATYARRGYLVEPWGEVTIDGFRTSDASVAAFRFAPVARSYAARVGDARDVGVIGIAVFPERERPRPPAALRAPESRGEAPAGRDAAGAPSAAQEGSGERHARRGLGTEFGEEHESRVVEVPFERAGSRPEVVRTLRYDDRAGLAALGIDVERHARRDAEDRWLRDSAEPFRRSRWTPPPPGWTPGR